MTCTYEEIAAVLKISKALAFLVRGIQTEPRERESEITPRAGDINALALVNAKAFPGSKAVSAD